MKAEEEFMKSTEEFLIEQVKKYIRGNAREFMREAKKKYENGMYDEEPNFYHRNLQEMMADSLGFSTLTDIIDKHYHQFVRIDNPRCRRCLDRYKRNYIGTRHIDDFFDGIPMSKCPDKFELEIPENIEVDEDYVETDPKIKPTTPQKKKKY